MIKKATFGAGCFWCVETIYKELKGVSNVYSGYMGGMKDDPTYEEVCTGMTGHAEVIQLEYDEEVTKYEELLEIFWKVHDPTTLNRQGADVGTQYRSVIFYHDEQQQKLAEQIKTELDASGAYDKPIVTEISEAVHFYQAEAYHQDYFINNPGNGYCQMVVRPKIEKFRKVFESKLK